MKIKMYANLAKLSLFFLQSQSNGGCSDSACSGHPIVIRSALERKVNPECCGISQESRGLFEEVLSEGTALLAGYQETELTAKLDSR